MSRLRAARPWWPGQGGAGAAPCTAGTFAAGVSGCGWGAALGRQRGTGTAIVSRLRAARLWWPGRGSALHTCSMPHEPIHPERRLPTQHQQPRQTTQQPPKIRARRDHPLNTPRRWNVTWHWGGNRRRTTRHPKRLPLACQVVVPVPSLERQRGTGAAIVSGQQLPLEH